MTTKKAKTGSTTALVPATTAEQRFPVLTSGQRITTALKETLGGESLSIADLDRISIPGAGGIIWSYTKNGEDQNPKGITGIIVHHGVTRLYFAAPYGAGEKMPPTCWSKDGITGIGLPGGECMTCPLSQWDSKTDAKGNHVKGQACQQRRLLFVLLEGEYLPRVISVPPSSLQASKKYLVGLAGQGLSHSRVLTEISLLKTQNAGGIPYAELRFKMLERLAPETAERAQSYGAQIKAAMGKATGEDMTHQNTDEKVAIEELPA